MPHPPDLLQRLQSRVDSLPDGLKTHIYRARDVALELASRHGADPHRTELGMLAHDVMRATPGRELLKMAEREGLPVNALDRRLPILLHGPVGAESVRREDGLADDDILEAVRWHSTAHPGLSPLGKLVFIADKLDPQKAAAYSYQPELRKMADDDLDLAVLEFLSRETEGRIQRREPVHPISIETINCLLATRSRTSRRS